MSTTEVRTPVGRRTWPPALALLTLAAALCALAIAALIRVHSIHDSGEGADNQALVDAATTRQVVQQVTTGLTAVLSYNDKEPRAAQQATSRWLTGDAPQQYALLLSQLKQLAKGQALTLTAKVVSAGVVSLRGDTAQLLIFVDQQSTRLSDNRSRVAGAEVQITAIRHGTTWLISELKPL